MKIHCLLSIPPLFFPLSLFRFSKKGDSGPERSWKGTEHVNMTLEPSRRRFENAAGKREGGRVHPSGRQRRRRRARGEGRGAPRARVQAQHFAPPVCLGSDGWGAADGSVSRQTVEAESNGEAGTRKKTKTRCRFRASLSLTRIPNGWGFICKGLRVLGFQGQRSPSDSQSRDKKPLGWRLWGQMPFAPWGPISLQAWPSAFDGVSRFPPLSRAFAK